MFNDMETLDINLGNYEIDDRGNSKYAIYTQELVTTLSELVNVDEKDIQLSRTALLFEMEKTGEKKVAVIPDFSINFSGQYDLYKDVSITPEDITVYGPQNALDSLLFIKTIKVEMENINSDVEIKVELFNPFPQLLTFETNEITLKIEVEKFTESELVVPINLSGMNYHVKTFPSQVTVYYKVAQKDFNDVRPHQFNIIPVIDDLNITNAKKLPLRIENHSDFARNIRIVPTEVEFLIIK